MKSMALLDMDGVIVDFVRGVLNHHDRTDDPKFKYDSLEWNFDKRMFPDNLQDFWKGLDFKFWSELNWTPNGRNIYAEVVRIFGVENVSLCSSPSKTPGCMDGKLEWINRHIPELARQYILAPTKKFMAHPRAVLIDDREENVNEFRERGGQVILVPQPWNSNANWYHKGLATEYIKIMLETHL